LFPSFSWENVFGSGSFVCMQQLEEYYAHSVKKKKKTLKIS